MFPLPNLIQVLYRNIFQPLLFSFDAEAAHNVATHTIGQLERVPPLLHWIGKSLTVEDPRLAVHIRSLSCRNPVGLAAGFDKGADLLNVLSSFGFGFIEVGTFTPLPQSGQEKPRLFRYKEAKALVNRMGFNNPGVRIAAQKLAGRAQEDQGMALGVNIGKGKETPIEEAADDYVNAFDIVAPHADYIVLNVSSPNTPNLRSLQALKPLQTILSQVVSQNRLLAETSGQPPKLIFVKVSPDNSWDVLEEIVRICVALNVGIVATNTTVDHARLKKHPQQTGGLSGDPLRERSNRVIQKIYQLSKGVIPIIGVGGIFSAADAYEKIRLGASLVQVYTGWIYEGPGLVPQINKGLLRLMERDGFKRIQDAVGTL